MKLKVSFLSTGTHQVAYPDEDLWLRLNFVNDKHCFKAETFFRATLSSVSPVPSLTSKRRFVRSEHFDFPAPRLFPRRVCEEEDAIREEAL